MSVYKNQRNYKQFTAICPTSKIMFSRVYSSATSFAASIFLREFLEFSPFEVKSIQVDGGSEFMKHFENECANEQIPLYVLPPASPKYNGNVERSNRTCRTEFYSLPIFAENVTEMNFNWKNT